MHLSRYVLLKLDLQPISLQYAGVAEDHYW
jgi:hypothetical protein